MITLIKNGTVVSMNLNETKKYDVLDLVFENDTITYIGKNYKGPYDTLIEASNKVVMPGLINTHAHLGMSLFRGINDTDDFNNWWINHIRPYELKFTEKEVYLNTLYSCIEMIRTGTTTVCDMYFEKEGILKAVKKSKVRTMFPLYFIFDYNDDAFKSEEDFYLKHKDDSDLINYYVSLHSFYTTDEKQVIECKNLADKYNLPLGVHFAEHQGELNTINEKYKLSPVRVLNKFNLLNNKLILFHGTHINDEELEILKDHNISINHNPVSNLNLGCGIADIPKYMNYNLNISLGTDGQGSGNNMNMFYHMSLVDYIQKGIYQKADILNSYDVLKMATINGAKALGLEKEVGSLEVGKKADIIILDMNKLLTFPYNNLIPSIVHNTIPDNIETTIINGEILMKDHKILLDIDENKLIEDMKQSYKELENK